MLQAAPCLGTNAVGVFTNLANLFLAKSGCNFTVTNIPVFDGTNFVYSPAVNRLLQVAANIYDATTNRTFSDGTSPSGPFCPTVFRPTFGRNGNVVFINGFVEEGDGTTSYQAQPLSLPQDLALVSTNTTNIYGVPWIIGARKGFPNFNKFSVYNFLQVSRVLQVVKPYAGAPAGTWQTNIMYVIGISNLIAAQAWNSYSSNYPRAVDIIASDNLTVGLTNDDGFSSFSSFYTSSFPFAISSNTWPVGFFHGTPISNSFQVPLYFGTTLISNCVYQQNPPTFLAPGILAFQNEPGFAFPHFILNTTNKLRFVMLDHATGRVIDYVHFDRAAISEDLAAELNELNAAPSGVWNSNVVSASNLLPIGILTQFEISEGAIQISPAYWTIPGGTMPSQNSIQQAIAAFDNFLISSTGNTVAQLPYTPSVLLIRNSSWQANDPLVHYTIEDLTDLNSTNNLSQGLISGSNSYILNNLSLPNARYGPWGNVSLDHRTSNVALQDPLITNSDAWNFPSGQPLDFSWVGSVHRGTPWQTLYLKSKLIDLPTWQYWTGNPNPSDATLALPEYDWLLASALSTLLNTNSPARRVSVNQPDAAWPTVFQGMTALTNSSGGLIPFTIDTNVDAAAITTIIADIEYVKTLIPGGIFTDLYQVLAVPSLSANSPFINTTSLTSELNDAAYESIPSQLLPLLRIDSIGSAVVPNYPAQFQFSGVDGAAYVVQASTNLQDWQAIGTFYPTNGAFQFTDPSGDSNGFRFYRSMLLP